MNPVRGGLSASPVDYRWSSHLGNAGLGDNHFLRAHCEYEALGEDPARRGVIYRTLFNGDEDPGFLSAIRAATNGGYALIGDRLKARLAGNAVHRLDRGKPGRRPAEEPREGPLNLELGL
jgi:putative transposase